MDDTGALMGIGAFARRVGLAPSALRFYDDCAVLRPAHVDEATGYRYYDPAQQARAVLLRRLRAAGLPLTDAVVVLDGSRDEARSVLESHARKAQDTADAAQAAFAEILRDLPGGVARARVGGAELASAIRQVAPAVAGAGARAEFPVLGCVLVELDGQEARLVATDRYRLAIRTLPAQPGVDIPRRVLIPVAETADIARWVLPLPEVDVEVDAQGARLRGGEHVRALPTVDGTFPDYQLILDHLPGTRHRVIVDRLALRAAIVDLEHGGRIVLSGGDQQLVIAAGPGNGTTVLPAILTGPPLRVAFDPEVLLPALDAGVGPDVLLEISAPTQPVVVRSADQGSFTTLVMPVADTDQFDRE